MRRFDVVVAYDVSTTTRDGERRLRRVAKVCQAFGQRVQLSVFECRVTQAQLESLEARLRKVMNMAQDSLRIYVLGEGRERSARVHGRDRYRDFDEPLVI